MEKLADISMFESLQNTCYSSCCVWNRNRVVTKKPKTYKELLDKLNANSESLDAIVTGLMLDLEYDDITLLFENDEEALKDFLSNHKLYHTMEDIRNTFEYGINAIKKGVTSLISKYPDTGKARRETTRTSLDYDIDL